MKQWAPNLSVMRRVLAQESKDAIEMLRKAGLPVPEKSCSSTPSKTPLRQH